MENASKALIIAGAILLSILIISLGIIVFRQASGAAESTSMDEFEIATFNEKFTQYQGTSVRGSQVNALLSQIAASNVANSEDESKQVTVMITTNDWISKPLSYNAGKITSGTAAGQAKGGKTYKVTCTASNSKTGLIDIVVIGDVTTSDP